MTVRAENTTNPVVQICDNFTEALLLGLLAWLPLAFGGVLPVSHAFVVGVTATAALLLTVRCTLGGAAFRWSWTYLPVFAFVGLLALQALPLPWSLLELLSPGAAAQWRAMLSAPPLIDGLPTRLPMTLYPGGTAHDLPLLAAGAVLLVVIVHVYHSARRVERLLGWAALVGGAVALIGLAQTLLGATAIYWTVPVPGKATGGPFVHYGHFSQFLNLSIGAALAVILLRLTNRSGKLHHNGPDVLSDLTLPGRQWDWTLLAIVVLSMLAIALSHSRNGLLSMCIGGIVVAATLHRTHILRGTGWLLALMVAGALVSLLFLGFDPVYDRMATLEDPSEALEGRVALIRDSMSVVADHPILGIGQGAFEYVFPQYDTSIRPGRAQHAENFYVELLVETGAVGITLFLALATLVTLSWRQRLRHQHWPIDIALGGLLFGVVAVMFHAGTDFGLRVPSNATLLTVILGIVVSRTARPMVIGHADAELDEQRPSRKGQFLATVFGVGGATFLAFQLPSIVGAYHADHEWRAAQALTPEIQEAPLAREQELYAEQQAMLDAAVEHQPMHAEYVLRRAWLRYERTIALHTTDRPDDTPFTEAELADITNAAREAQQLALEARRYAPTYGMLWSLAGQLGLQWLDQPEAGEWIVRGMQMSPESPDACLAAGRYLLTQGKDDEAAAAFRRAIDMRAGSARVLEALVIDADRPDIAAAVAADNPRLMTLLLRGLKRLEGLEELAAKVRDDTATLLQGELEASDAAAWMVQELAAIQAEAGKDTEAIRLYRRFLASKPDNVNARYQLAVILDRSGDTEAAKAELRRLRINSPNFAAAKRLLEQIERR